MTNRTGVRVAGTVIAVLGLAAGCGSKWLSGGKLHFDQGRFEKALETFQNAVNEEPQNGEAHLWLGRALAELERDEEAKVEILRAGEMSPEQAEMVTNTMESYWSRRFNSGLSLALEAQQGLESERQARLEQAVDRFQRASIFAPDSAQNYSNLGKVLFQLGRQDEALQAFDQARQLSIGRKDVQDFLWKVYLSAGQTALEAKTAEGFQRAINLFNYAAEFERSPAELADINFNIGYAYLELAGVTEDEAAKKQFLADSQSHFLKTLEVNPEDAAALQNLAYVYSDLGDHEKAIAMGQRLLDLQPWDKKYVATMTMLYNAAGDREKSAGYYVVAQAFETAPATGAGARGEASSGPPRNDMLMTLLDRAEPQITYEYQSSRGLYKVWAYWTDGRIYVFKEYEEVFRIAFKGMKPEKFKEIFGSVK